MENGTLWGSGCGTAVAANARDPQFDSRQRNFYSILSNCTKKTKIRKLIPSPNQSAMRVQWSIAMPKTRKTGIRISDRTKCIIDLAPHTHTHLNTKKYQFNPQTDFGCTQLVVLYYLHFRLVFDAATAADGGYNLFVPLKRVITFNVAPLFSLKTSTPQSSSRQNLMIIIPNRHKNITIAK